MFRLSPYTATYHLNNFQDYKVTSIPIALDWLIRHGELSVDTCPDISQILAEIHLNLHQLYSTE